MDNIIENNLTTLEEKLGYQFKSQELLIISITHKSSKNKPHNERLEFLGDGVVNLVIGFYLCRKFPSHSEGKLSKLRASLVNEYSLALLANYITLGDYVFLSKGEKKNKGKEKPSILSDAFEAVIGAIFVEAGFETAQKVLISLVEKVYNETKLEDLYQDYKTILQELTQSSLGVIPQYDVVKEEGPEHNKIFTVSVLVQNKKIAIGLGKSKKYAQQDCAQKALEVLQNE